MDFIAPLINLTIEALRLWNHEKATEFQDKVYNLLKRYDNEVSKGHLRDDALVDCIRIELRDICELYGSQLKGSLPQDKP